MDTPSCLSDEPDAVAIFKTIFLFLQNHHFPRTAETLRKEWGLDITHLEQVPNKSILLSRCTCCKNQANQTEVSKARGKNGERFLEGTFQGEKIELKMDNTRIFFVCDHFQEAIKHKDKRNPSLEACRGKAKEPDLRNQFRTLQDEHHKLLTVTSELTNALQFNIIGQTKSICGVLDQCKTIYPSLFHNTLQLNQEVDQSMSEFMLRINPEEKKDEVMDKGQPKMEDARGITPDTVRNIVEGVFEKIFEHERGSHTKSPMTSDEVKDIVGDIINVNPSSASLVGGGEGECVTLSPSNQISKSNVQMDYVKLKADLIQSDSGRKIRILQALRWKITKTNGEQRQKVLDEYVKHDILDLFSDISLPERLLLGIGMDHYVQESACRLINTLASLKQGRDYLSQDDRLLKRVLIRKVKDVRTVSGAVIRNMLVASVQKLSIRKHCREHMVQDGLFEVVVDYLEDFYDKLSKYCLEYCSALLMNLCLVNEAKKRAVKMPKKIAALLKKFLTGETDFCLPYINGVMFSLFERSDIANEARSTRLDKDIQKIIQNTTDENIKKQLEFILHSRIYGQAEPKSTESDEESREEVDLLEPELDQDDVITQMPSGECLLQEYMKEVCLVDLDKQLESTQMVSVTTNPPNSVRSFCEETKQFYYKPSERGIFEPAKTRRFTTCSQSLAKNVVRNKSQPVTNRLSMCYMENCQKLQYGVAHDCSCTQCVPSQSRYSCGCYDAIKNDLGDFEEPKFNPKSSIAKIEETTPAIKPKKSAHGVDENFEDGRTKSSCKLCGAKKCECAFESRPKLCRTPTLYK